MVGPGQNGDAPPGRVTVVIPTRNRPTEVVQAVASALRHRPIVAQVVVVDSGSTNGALDGLADLPVDVLAPGGDVGVSAARNLGLLRATAEWVTFLDDDDRLADGWSAAIGRLVADPRVGLVSGAARFHREQDEDTVPARSMGAQFHDVEANALAGAWVARRSLLHGIGGYTAGLRHSENIELFLRLTTALRQSAFREDTVADALVVVNRTAVAGVRASADDAAKAEATALLLRDHREQLMRLPQGLGSVVRAGAVASARLGDYPQARRWFVLAGRLGGHRPSDAARAIVASLPPLARRVWGPPSSAT